MLGLLLFITSIYWTGDGWEFLDNSAAVITAILF